MVWKIVTVEYFDDWFLGLDASEQQNELAAILVLEQYGPMLGRPHVDSLKGTDKVKNLKELRVQHKTGYFCLCPSPPGRDAMWRRQNRE